MGILHRSCVYADVCVIITVMLVSGCIFATAYVCIWRLMYLQIKRIRIIKAS